MKGLRRIVSTLVVLGLIGCGLDVVGIGVPASDGDAGPAGLTADAAVTADVVIDAVGAVAPPTCPNLPSSWGLVALVAEGADCPLGYDKGQIDLVADPTPRADACTCACSLDAQPTCTGKAGATYDNNNSDACDVASTYAWATITNGTCGTDMWPGPYTTNHDWKWAAPTLMGGSCKAAPDKHADRIDTKRAQRACVPASCEGAPAAPIRRCVVSDGDVACPVGSTFTERSSMAKSVDFTCTGSCNCVVTGACSSATLAFYADVGCAGASFSMEANGKCQSSPGTISVKSYRYTATVTGAGCTASGTVSPSAATSNGLTTVCCEP